MSVNMNKLRRHCRAMWQKRQEGEPLLLSDLPTTEYVPAPAYLLAYCSDIGLMPSEERSFYQLIARACAQMDDQGKSIKITKEGCWQLNPETGEMVCLASWYGRNSYHVSDLLAHTWIIINQVRAKASRRWARQNQHSRTPAHRTSSVYTPSPAP